MRAELAAPDHERIFQHPALLQVLNQGRARLVGVLAVVLQVVDQVAVLVPRLVEDLHEPHASLQQPARQQAGVGERRLGRVSTIQVQHVLRLPRDVHHLRRDCCIRKAISNELIRVAISGSPTRSRCAEFSSLIAASDSACNLSSTPLGFDR